MTDIRTPAVGRGVLARRRQQADTRPKNPRKPWVSGRRRERIGQLLFLAPAVVYLLAFFGYPIVKNVVMGFQEYTTRTFFTGEAPWVGLANYREVMSSSIFSQAVTNTVVFTVASIAGQF